ncbi:restriction endonuclease subunit S [Nocardioides albus]|uniref:Type I restriction enzyme S subunit n=1 Tax=Nocardioides albus TaxID=1841 RepID=A0A7W5A207_9ACTN|nr:restriction endonuclease subunit S [Nocardioides albus]MBB3088243.1 type I restriction enzyme S subunit [Nocardioides albus]GGU42823.1 hypothetical protein GCM10007979_47630 [Nocardioides albus]
MGEWMPKSLADVIELRRGFDLPHREREDGPFPVLSAGVTAGWHSEGPVKGPGFVVGRATNLGVPTWSEGDFWPLNTTLYAADFKGNDPKFLYHLFEFIDLSGFDSGSVQPMLNRNYIAGVEVRVPDLATQRSIAEVLGALDDKIAANDRAIASASRLADAIISSAMATASKVVLVDEIAEFHNRRRVPLSSRDRGARRGTVPYYGAASRMDYVDEPIFDECLVLVGEDGSVVRDDGTPVVQYIWGPAWVNNHAHVLTGRGVSTELLRHIVRRANVSHLVTGAVQPKISMSNLKRLEVELPLQHEDVDSQIQELAAIERALTDESARLAATRDELLPLLMSGKLRVTDVGAGVPA